MTMKNSTVTEEKDLKRVQTFIYKFGYTTSIKDEMYPAYYTAWLISIFGCDIDEKFIEEEKKQLQERLDRKKHENSSS